MKTHHDGSRFCTTAYETHNMMSALQQTPLIRPELPKS